jgi:hypothetical protein
MIGTWTVTVNAVKPFNIHGDEYFELHVTHAGDKTDHLVRVPRHAVTGSIAVPSQVTLTFLMGQVTEVRLA